MRTSALGAALVVVAALGLAACGGGNGSSATTHVGSTTTFSIPTGSSSHGGGGGGSTEPPGPPTGKIRVANFFAAAGQPGPAIDLYDTSRPGPSDKPLISDLVYGALSSYVSPRADSAGSGAYANLYIFPAGSKTTGKMVDGLDSGSNISNAGWQASQQVTYVIGANATGPSGTANAAFQEIDETWPSTEQPTFVTAPAGKGVIVVNDFGLPQENAPDAYLRIDGQCPSNVDTTSGQPNGTDPGVLGSAANFVVSTGSHALDVVFSSSAGSGLSSSQCASATAAGGSSATATVSSSTPTLVLLYGPAGPGAKLLVTTIG